MSDHPLQGRPSAYRTATALDRVKHRALSASRVGSRQLTSSGVISAKHSGPLWTSLCQRYLQGPSF